MCLAVPGRVVEVRAVDALQRTGTVDFAGVMKEVDLSYTPEAGVGDYVIVHAGFAISVVDEEEAARTLELLRQIGQTEIL